MKKLIKRYFILLLLLSSFSVFSKALIEDRVLSKKWPISHFMVNNEPILLTNSDSSYSLSFPVSDRVIPDMLDIDLHSYNSNKLKASRSQLVVYINGFYAGQVTLSPDNAEKKTRFSIDPEYLVTGYNRLTFRVAQHYTDEQCEDWSAPELWTQIDSVKTMLTLHYHKRDALTSLAQLNTLINNRLNNYNISFLRSEDRVTDDYLYWGALAAQGVKLRLDYVPMNLSELRVTPFYTHGEFKKSKRKFNIDPLLIKQDAILFGTKTQLKNILAPGILNQIQGPYLGLFRQDNDQSRFFLVISGINAQQVSNAAKAFSLSHFSLPDSQQTIIKKIDDLSNKKLVLFNAVEAGKSYLFAKFGFSSQELNKENDRVDIKVNIPANIYSTENAMVTLRLNLAYGAAIRKDSVINILLNGLFNHAIRLKEIEGAHYRNYQVNIPLRNFKPGLNVLSFKAILNPSEYGECTWVQHKNLKVTLYQDSLISFPDAGEVAVLPDLNLLGKAGYPFVKYGRAHETYIQLLDHSSDTIQSAWHFIARLAEFTKTPLFDIKIGHGNQQGQRKNLVLIGKYNDAVDVLRDAPVALGEWNRLPYPYKEMQQMQKESLLQRLERVFFNDDVFPLASISKPENIQITQSGGLGHQFLLMSYPSKTFEKGVTLALLSEKGSSLYSGFETLLSSGLWYQMRENIFIWNTSKQFYAIREGDTFVDGEDNVNLNLIRHFSKHFWQWVLIVVGLLILISGVIYKLLAQYKKSVHPSVNEDVE